MLGPHRWIVFTIVGGILLSIHIDASDLATKALTDPEIPSFTNTNLGITIENLKLVPATSRRQLRNLVPPYQEFSSVDGIQFIDGRSRNSKKLPGTFGSFRFDVKSSSPSPFRRRSDEYDDSIGTLPAGQLSADDASYDFDYGSEDNSSFTLLQSTDRFRTKVIPITFTQEAPSDVKTEGQQKAEATKESEERSSKQLEDEKSNSSADSEQVRFPEESAEMPQAEALTARRSGIHFTQNESEIKPQSYNPFVPQAYSEESLSFGESIPQFQRPFNNEDVVENENDRSAVSNRYYRPFIQPFRDDVTKFGDHNGPITTFNRPVREYTEQFSFPRTQYESTGFTENARPPRHFFPPKVYTEFAPGASDYTPQINAKYYQPPTTQQPTYAWKTRQPRVVFPPTDFTAGTTYVGNDNVVFR